MNGRAARTGRPPGPHEDTLDKLLPVALRLFLDEGGHALTPTRLAAESGVGRATIYRNWPDPADLVEIMLERATEHPPTAEFSNDLSADLHTAVDLLLDRFERKPVRPFFAACLEYGRRSEQVALAAERFIAGITEPFHTALRTASAGGQFIDSDEARDDVVSELAGPLIYEHVILGRTVPRARAHQLVDDLIARLN